MRIPLLSADTDDRADERLNPYENQTRDQYDLDNPGKPLSGSENEQLSSLEQSYANSNYFPRSQNPSSGASNILKDSEETSPSGHTIPSSFSGMNKVGNVALKTALKKGSPIAATGGGLVGLISVVGFFAAPGAMINHLTEVLDELLDQRMSPLERRAKRITQAKIENTESGCAAGKKCKYSSGFSDQEIKNMNDADPSRFSVESEDIDTPKGPRKKLTSFTIDKKKFTSFDYKGLSDSNHIFSYIMDKSFGGAGGLRFASKWDSVAKRVFNVRKIGRGPPFENAKNNADRMKKLEELSTEGSKEGSPPKSVCSEESSTCTDEEKEADKKKTDEAEAKNKELNGLIEESKKGGTQAGKLAKATKAGTRSANLMGGAYIGCDIVSIALTTARGMKLVQYLQMARFAMPIFTTASMIKSGDATIEDVSFIGNEILNKVVQYEDGSTSKTASEAFAYRSVAYGDKGLSDEAAPYVLGASFGKNKSTQLLGGIIKEAGGLTETKKKCKMLNNPWVVAGTTALSIVTMLPPITVARVGQTVAQGALAVAMIPLQEFLTARLIDLMAGKLIDDSTFGERAFNIAVPGMAMLMSDVAGNGAAAPLRPSQVKAKRFTDEQTRRQYAVYDRMERSPLDITSPNTFLGSIYGAALRHTNFTLAPSGIASSITSITSSIGNSLVPRIHAETENDYSACGDPEYRNINLGTDEFCVPYRGIPSEYLGTDPDVIVNHLAEMGLLDQETLEPNEKYTKDFLDVCVNRELPMGDTGDDFQGNSGEDCFIEDSTGGSGWLGEASAKDKAFLYLYQMDVNTNETLESKLSVGSQGSGAGGSYGEAVLEASSGAWGGHKNGKIPDSSLSPIAFSTEHKLHKDAARGLEALNEKYKQQFGVDISVTSSYRTYERQVTLRQELPDLAAPPGTSNHGWGLAVDLGGGIEVFGSVQHEWMKQHAREFGYIHPTWAQQGGRKPEPWHWEYARPVS